MAVISVLSSLNGTNGFKLDGENNGDLSGVPSVNAGDINGDGYADLLIGALEAISAVVTMKAVVMWCLADLEWVMRL